ncbi:MAG: hypothetical protein ACOYOI_09460, partial [Chthoniobacterales bacterium]
RIVRFFLGGPPPAGAYPASGPSTVFDDTRSLGPSRISMARGVVVTPGVFRLPPGASMGSIQARSVSDGICLAPIAVGAALL